MNTLQQCTNLEPLSEQKDVEFLHQGLVNQHIRELVRQRSSFHEALNLFEKISLLPELNTCIEIIRGFCNRGEVDPAINLLRRMTSEESFKESRPNTLAYNLILAALSRISDRARVSEMRELFVEMRGDDRSKPDESSYSFYILGLYRAGRFDDAMVVKKDMVENNWKPNRIIYSALITGFCRSGLLDQARKQLREMIKLGVDPDAVCFTSIIDALERSGRFDESLEFFKWMMSLGCKPDRVLSTRLLDCFIDRGELAQGVRFLQELLENGLCSPAMSSIHLLVRRLCIVDKLDEGIRVVKMMNERGVHASLLVYLDLIAGLCEKKRVREAADVYFDGKLLGHSLEDHLSPVVFQKLWGVKQEEEKLAEMMSRSRGDVCAYNFRLARLDCYDQRLELLQKMIDEGIVPDYQSYELVIKGLCRAGKGLEGYRVLVQLVASSRVPSRGICCRVVDSLLESDEELERVKVVLRKMIDDGYVPDDRLARVIARIL